MDSRRLNYLRAMDIDVWQRRDLMVSNAATVVAEPVQLPAAVMPAPRSLSVGESRQVATPPAARAAVKAPAPPSPRVLPASPDVSGLGWDELSDKVRHCTLCDLHKTRTNPVFGVGDRSAQWMIIGEAPGADEDLQGEPFVGKAGQLLNSMLRAIGLAREQVFIANILKSRPPANRDPHVDEVHACLPYLYRQIELVNPRLLLCIGRIAAQTLLNTDTTIGKLRGKLHHLPSGRPMIVTYHPAYLLRSPAEKRKSWADLVMAMQTFERLGDARA